ncbi:MAG: cysteine-rich CWC family protein [Desulfovibrionaceae bacterium]|nr:cysteine-rich CWC family protein [Desulfovibrionaceae bacterium]
MKPSATPIDPARCPLCGGPNGCAMAQPPAQNGNAPQPCWCAHASFTPALLERVPPQARRKACICARCAAADTGAAKIMPPCASCSE